MNFRFWNKTRNNPGHEQPARALRKRSTASYGGMQERVIQAHLEILVDAVLTRKRSVITTARSLAKFSLVDQERFLNSVDQISLINQELAFHFCMLATPALTILSDKDWEHWVTALLAAFNNSGLDSAIACIEDFDAYQPTKNLGDGSVTFAEVSRVLELFIRALNGRELKIASAEQSYTDTETLYLPSYINRYKTRDENFLLYKSLLVHQWAQTWFGTWQINLSESLQEYSDTHHALQVFHTLETLRLDACLQRELPGIAREMARFRSTEKSILPLWIEAEEKLKQANANVQTSLHYLSLLYSHALENNDALYQGELRTQETSNVIAERQSREKLALQKNLDEIRDGLTSKKNGGAEPPPTGQSDFSITTNKQKNNENLPENELKFSGQGVDVTPEMQALINSIAQDNNEIPQQYMDNSETDIADLEPEPTQAISNTEGNIDHEYSYDEWDHARQSYRKNWCQLQEQSVTPVEGFFVSETLNKYHFLLKHLRRTFEALRQENHQARREPFGDDIDIDAAVEAWTDICNGQEASDRLFIQTRREDRNVAVMFMIDMSASTAGWINRVERESLVLLCEALELLGDRYAIYGFSGHGNKHCQSYHIKDFAESYNDEVRNRIQGIEPHDYTRMGTAVRHLGSKLNNEEARTRLLIILSDGRPDDIGGYRDRYGIEDTRMAITEVKHLGITPYCITIDTDAREYISHMFGRNNFTIINEVDKLPQRIADIYRRITH